MGVASVAVVISVGSCLFCWRGAVKLSQVKPKVVQTVVGKAVDSPAVDVEGVVVPGHAVRDIAEDPKLGMHADTCVHGAERSSPMDGAPQKLYESSFRTLQRERV